jgi:DNA-binding transcriptional ArsR family regulator
MATTGSGDEPTRGEPQGGEAAARSVTRVTDPRALRALAHPLRMALIGMLRMQGPLTATQAGALLGESSGSTSFHLRSLAKYGLVEEAPGGQGRERPWRATAMFTQWGDDISSPAAAAASDLLTAVVAQQYFEDVKAWLTARAEAPPEWREAAHFGDTELWLTAAELAGLAGEIRELTDRFLDRSAEPGLRPPGSRPVTFLHLAFPMMSVAGWPVPPGLAETGPSPTEASPAPSAAHPATNPTSPAGLTRPSGPGESGGRDELGGHGPGRDAP